MSDDEFAFLHDDPILKSYQAAADREGLGTYMPKQHYGDFLTIFFAAMRRSAQAQKKMIWTPASEKLPEGRVLVVFLEPFFGKFNPETTVASYDESDGWTDWYTQNKIHVTHWMALPALPEVVQDVSNLPTQEQVIAQSVRGTVTLRVGGSDE